MTNKARNIYIDTTGFCEDALRRVDEAIELLVEKQFLRAFESKGGTYFGSCLKAIDDDGFPIGRDDAEEFQSYDDIVNPRQVWLFELESLAGIR